MTVIRPATVADLDAVAAIYAHYVEHSVFTFDETAPPVSVWQDRLDDLASRELPFLVTESDGVVAGYAYASPWRPKPAYRHSVENSIYLAPGHTGRGLGAALLRSLIATCTKAGKRQMIAVIADSGTDASFALHRQHGFEETGRLTAVGFKHGRWLDTVLMQRPLGGAGTGPATAP